MLTILAWFVGGNILRTLATASLAATLGFGAGYVTGWISTDKSHEIAALRQTIVNLETEQAAAATVAAEAAKQAEADAKAENETAVTFGSINEAINNAKEVPSGYSAGFLNGLRRLK